MALIYSNAGSATAASGASPVSIISSAALAVGDMLMVLMAYDNSGGSGADPLTNFAVSPAAGAMTVVSTQTGLNDPGAASAGIAARCNTYVVTTAIPLSTNFSLSWTGTVVVRAQLMAKVTSGIAGTVISFRTNSGATGTNVVANVAGQLTTPSVTTNELVLCWVACEFGVILVADADTTNGSWGTIMGANTGATTSGISVAIQGKVVTAVATQSFDPTNGGNSTDWILGAVILTELPPPIYPIMAPMIPSGGYRQ